MCDDRFPNRKLKRNRRRSWLLLGVVTATCAARGFRAVVSLVLAVAAVTANVKIVAIRTIALVIVKFETSGLR